MDLNKNRPLSLYWPSIIYHSVNFELLSHSIALRSELVVHGYPSLSWTWDALALSCLVWSVLDLGASGLEYLNLVLEYPSLSWTWGYLTIGCLDKNMEYPGLSSTSGLPVLVWEDPGLSLTRSQPDWDKTRGEISHRNNLLSIIFLIYLFPEKHISVARLTI